MLMDKLKETLQFAGIYMTDKLQGNVKHWTDFLEKSSNHYSRNFVEQLLIVAQKPGVTAVMEEERWKQIGYQLKQNQKSIAVFKDFTSSFCDEQAVNATIVNKYYDISQVNPINNLNKVTPWNIDDVNENRIINMLANNYEAVSSNSLPIAVITAINSVVNQPDDRRKEFIINSAAYQVLARCGYNPDSIFVDSDFSYIKNINTDKALIDIGVDVSNASADVTKNIARFVRNEVRTQNTEKYIDRQYVMQYNINIRYKNNTNANKEITTNGNDISSGRRYIEERTNNNIRRMVDRRKRYATSSNSSNERGPEASGQLRSNAPEVYERGETEAVRRTNVTGQYDGLSEQYRTAGSDTQGHNNRTAEESLRSDRGAESQRPNAVGGSDEQHNSLGGGDSVERNNLRITEQLEYFDRKTEDNSLPFSNSVNEFIRTYLTHEELENVEKFYISNTDTDIRFDYIKNLFSRTGNIKTSNGKSFGAKPFENVLYMCTGTLEEPTSQSYYNWGAFVPYINGMLLTNSLYEESKEFAVSKEIINYLLISRSSSFENGKFRIYEQFQKNTPLTENANFLKNEYGWGGVYPAIAGTNIDLMSDGKGLKISNGFSDKNAVTLNWNTVSKYIGDLIKGNRYLNEKELIAYEKWHKKRELEKIEVSEEVSEQDTVENIVDNTEYVYAYSAGDTIYIGTERYTVNSISDDTVTLNNADFPLFAKEYKVSDFDALVNDNPMNDHLKKPVEEVTTVSQDSDTEKKAITVTCITSEHADIEDNKTYSLLEFDRLIKHLDGDVFFKKYEAEKSGDYYPYFKTRFVINNLPGNMKLEDRQDIGDGDGGLIDHIKLVSKNTLLIELLESEVKSQDAVEQIANIDTEDSRNIINNSDKKISEGNQVSRELQIGDIVTVKDRPNMQWRVDDMNPTAISFVNIDTTSRETSFAHIDFGANRDNVIENLGIEFIEAPVLSDTQEETNNEFEQEIDYGQDLLGKTIELDDRKFIVDSVSKTSDEVRMRDVTFNNAVGFPIERVSKIAYVRSEIERQANKDTAPAAEKKNYKITDKKLGFGTPTERYENNIAAIKTLKKTESENRLATAEEQEIMSQYVGWGGLANSFEFDNPHYTELVDLLTPEEFAVAQSSTLTAYYTQPVVINSIYTALENMGVKTGNILEPSCGTGNFIGMLPDSMDCNTYGVELDSISGRIAKQLYQKSNIKIQGYEKTNLPDNFFDVAVGNVPFGQFQVSDKKYNKNNFLIHDYFFAKTLDKVRPGGFVAFITSKGTMDKKNNSVRKYIAERADLLGAIRLPNNAFKGNAGTEVTSDIIFLQKKAMPKLNNPDWLYLKENADGILMNQYFADNPYMVVGNMQMISGPHGPVAACIADNSTTLEEQLMLTVSKIHGAITENNSFQDIDESIENESNIVTIPADPNVRNFSYTIVDGDLYYRKNSIMEKVEKPTTAMERTKEMINVRENLRQLIEYETQEYPEQDIKEKMRDLNTAYDRFYSKYGVMTSRGNKIAFGDDSSSPLLNSLEVVNDKGERVRKADIFTKRTIKPYIPVTHTDTSTEALAVSLNDKGFVDLDYMAQLTGLSNDGVIAELKGIIYRVPYKENQYQTSNEYLSGNVREKLFVAKNATETDPTFAENVTALEKVQPKDLTAGEVSIRLGATWLPAKYIDDFIKEILEPSYSARNRIRTEYSKITSRWNIANKSADSGSIISSRTYGTNEANAYVLLENSLNLQSIKIYDHTFVNGNDVRVLNPKKTMIARQKQQKIQDRFEEWIFSDPQRRKDLLRTYNDMFNNIKTREFDGSHLMFPGINPEIKLRPHQQNAIARTLYGGNTLLAHVVGAGKSFEMIASAMEAKRIGLCNKSLFVVPNHLTEQMGTEFLTLYPAANILVATKGDFTKQKRKEFCSRIATGDYDAVIIGHSQFEKLPLSIERQEQFICDEIESIIDGIAEAKEQMSENFTIKQMEAKKKSLEKKLTELAKTENKDDVVTLEEIGIDRLFVDEAHKFKNLFLNTKMTNVSGVTSLSANKSYDLLMKCRYLDEITNSKGIVFATGTPVSNSMAELFTMQRYLQNDTLNSIGFNTFDSWASTFGATITAMELAPEGKGYREKTRFSKFYNLPELMNIYKQCADVKTADMLNLPVPKAHYYNVVAKPSDEQVAEVESYAERAEIVRSGAIDPKNDNLLKITNDGRKLAVDQRLINPNFSDFEGSKVNKCVDNVLKIWQDTADKKSTQLVFCDLSTPNKDKFNVYDDIRNKLLNKGVPEQDIAFIHDYNTDSKKAELFAKVRTGDVRILLGSTEKMGAGTNIQDKLIALHDLDVPWRPSDLEQRAGRIIRQGNENKEVQIYRYITEDTFDAYSYQLIENKQRFISQIMSSKTPVREADDVDQSALSYAEIKMLATGNPLIKEKMDLDIKITKLKLLKADYFNAKYSIEDSLLSTFPKDIATKEKILSNYEKDLALAEKNKFGKDEFAIIINGMTYTDKKIASAKLLQVINNLPHRVETEQFYCGSYRGFSLSVGKFDNQPKIYIDGACHYFVAPSTSDIGNITKINNKIESISDYKANTEKMIENVKTQIERATVEASKPFEHAEELHYVEDRLKAVNELLDTGNKQYKYETVSADELSTIKATGIACNTVSDSTDTSKFIIRYEKEYSAIVAEALSSNSNSSSATMI